MEQRIKLEEKYKKAFYEMDDIISERVKGKYYTALGYTSNLDMISDFQVESMNRLLKQYLPDAKLEDMKAVKEIRTMEEFLETVVYFCSNGIGGEVDISDFSIIRNAFSVTNGMGGTATQGAMALAALGCPSIVHLTDDSREVCDILNSPYIYTISKKGLLVHTKDILQSAEQEIHYIIQFKKGDIIRLGEQKLQIKSSNRLIITKLSINKILPFSDPFFTYIEKNAKNVRSNVLSSFNAIQDIEILKDRLRYVKQHIMKYKAGNQAGITFFEDAHYHKYEVKRICMDTIYPYVDIVSFNEEELEYTLNMYGQKIDPDDIISCVEGIKYLKVKLKIKNGIIVHTKDYSMYVGEKLEPDIELGLMFGNILATAKAMSGRYGTRQQLREVLKLPLSNKGIENRNRIRDEKHMEEAILVPSKYIEKPKFTIGLGDSFVAGVQLCF